MIAGRVFFSVLFFLLGFSSGSNIICQNISWADSISQYKLSCFESGYTNALDMFILKSDTDSIAISNIFVEFEWLDSIEFVDAGTQRKLLTYFGYKLKKMPNQVDDAIMVYERAHQKLKYINDAIDFWYVENVLGTLYNMKGDHEKALYFYRFTERNLTKLVNQKGKNLAQYQDQLLRLKNNIGYLLFWDKQIVAAEITLKSNLLAAIEQKNYLAITNASKFLSEIYVNQNELDSLKKYQRLFSNSIENTEGEKKASFEKHNYQLSGKLALLEGRYKDAVPLFLSALSGEKEENRFDVKIYNQIAKAQIKSHDFLAAKMSIMKGFELLGLQFKKILDDQIYLPEENTLGELASTLSELYLKMYIESNSAVYLDSAEMAIQVAMKTYESIREGLLLENSKFHLIKDYHDAISDAISIDQIKYEKHPHQFALSLAKYAVVSKNLLLSDFEFERKQYEKLDSNERALITEKREKIRALTSQLQIEKNQDKRLELNGAILDLREEILNISKRIKASRSKENARKHDFIEFLIVKENVYGISNIRGKLNATLIGKQDEINKTIIEALHNIKSIENQKSLYMNLNELYDRLIAPFGLLPKKIAIYPDGLLHLIPFQALVMEVEPLKFLIEDHETYLGYNRTVIRKRNSVNQGIQIIAPNYQTGLEGGFAMTRGGLYHLAFAQVEVEEIASIYPHNSKVDNSCSKATFFKYLSKGRQIHYAGHTISNNYDAYLALSEDTASWVSVQEINRSTINTSRIVLSACETGLGQYHSGDGINSLAKSFLNAGAEEVVFSLWNINDQTTSALMADYYTDIKKGFSSSTSLRNAQLKYIKKNEGKRRHPYYWAAFSVMQPGIDQKTKNYWLLIGIAIIAALYFIYQRKKH